MPTISTGRDGTEYIHTNVLVTQEMKDFVAQHNMSMSKLLRMCLQKRMRRDAVKRSKGAYTNQVHLTTDDKDEVDG